MYLLKLDSYDSSFYTIFYSVNRTLHPITLIISC